MDNSHYDAIVLGAGPAGLTAGIYLSRAKVRTLIISEGPVGGQMILTHEIANYPGVESISGYQLAGIMKKQALSFGCKIIANETINKLDLVSPTKSIFLADGSSYTSDAIIIASGGRSKTIGVPGENQFKGRGISYCATCDGDFFTGKEIVVVGGGNTALEEAVSLTKYATKVTVIHRQDSFSAYEHAVAEAKKNEKINFLMNTVVTAFHGDESLRSVDIKNISTGQTSSLKTDGAFVFIGYVPNTEGFKDIVDMNDYNEINVNSDMSTSIPGVFSAGDNTTKIYRQITTATADGTIAALSTAKYLQDLSAARSLQELSAANNN